MRYVLVGLLSATIGFGAGWTTFSWRPWESSGTTTHDAEIAVLQQARMTSAECERREYPSGVFDCSAQNGCRLGSYVVRATADGLVVNREAHGGPINLPPIGC
jgi:hypothetical protein